MEIVLAIVLIILILIVRTNIQENSKLLGHLNDKWNSLNSEFTQLKQAVQVPPPTTPISVPIEVGEEVLATIAPIPIQVMETAEPEPVPEPVEQISATADLLAAVQQIRGKDEFEEVTPVQKPWWQQWLYNNPDIEKFIGENLINKIGIAVLVLGISFFVKYAIDQDWINETGRVCIGLVSGGILVGLAHRLRNSYRSFSAVLVGGGLSVFYFSIAYAFHQYHLMSQTAAFIVMVIITIFAILLSMLYNRIELAVLATIGGFITPFLVSTGSGNYVVLFSYLCILNTGLVVLAYYKRWRLVHFLAFFFTLIIYGGWLFNLPDQPAHPFKGGFLFASIFYVLFMVMNMLHHLVRKSSLLAFDFIILLSINFSYYAAGMYLLAALQYEAYQGLFTLCIGMINLALAFSVFKKNGIDKNVVFLLIGLTLSFISLTAPVQLSGNHITLFWATETVVLLWLYQQSFIKLLKVAALLIVLLTGISLFIDWIQVYVVSADKLVVIANKGFITSLVVSIAFLINNKMLFKEADTWYLPAISHRFLRTVYLIIGLGVLLVGGMLEIHHQFSHYFPQSGLEYTYLQLYVILFVWLLFVYLNRLDKPANDYFKPVVMFVVFCLYLINANNSYSAEKFVLAEGKYQWYFIAHLLSIVFLLHLFYGLIFHFRSNAAIFQTMYRNISWLVSLAVIVILSVEIQHLYIWISWQQVATLPRLEQHYAKAGLSIVWALASFYLIWLGMRYRYKTLRIIALVIFGITLIKLFVYDISNIAPAGKIVAFILLGAILLVVSFMYQRLKKMILDDTTKDQ
jgi:uncharacterized membrane protein